MIAFIHAASSHVGLVRTGNEDSGYADAQLLVVADGMGGHAAGEIASAAVVAAVCADLSDRPVDADTFRAWIDAKVEVANQRIGDLVAAEPERRGMGTTFTLLAAVDDRARIAHIGDSRAYRLRNGELTQLTKDHTYVQMLVDTGRLDPELAASHPRRNLLLRTIDGIHESEIDVLDIDVELGDRFLLCSDGLTTVVGDPVIRDVLAAGDPTYAVGTLIDFALAGGAPDNVSVIVADATDGEPQVDAVLIGAARDEEVRDDLGEVPLPVDGPPAPVVAVTAQVRRNTRWFAAGAVAMLLILSAFGMWLRQQWYVAPAGSYVAVYHGVPQSVGPFALSRIDHVTDVELARMPLFERERITAGIVATSRADADAIVARIAVTVLACTNDPTAVGCP